MLNIVPFSGNLSKIESLKDFEENISNIFSSDLFKKIQAVKNYQFDNLIIRGLSVPKDLNNTPHEIHGPVPEIFPAYLIKTIGSFLGEISEKGIENSIRFSTSKDGATNVETWHGHPQFKYSVFYCLRGDENAKTYFLSANDIIAKAEKSEKETILNSGIIKQVGDRYEFSSEIYQPSDFQQYIKNLDLPDTTKLLSTDKQNKAFKYLLKQMIDAEEGVVYQPGDIAIYNERETMRFSPSYLPIKSKGEERWLLGVGVC